MLVQSENIRSLEVTASVVHELETRMMLSARQLENMELMLVTLAVLKLLRSRAVRTLHPSNMRYMVVTRAVLKLERLRVFKL